MPPYIALILCVIFILYIFKLDSKSSSNVSSAIWIPLIWMMLNGSRYVSQWLNMGPIYYSPDDLLEGSPLDRNIFIFLIILGLITLFRRKINWKKTFRNNAWIFILLLYCGVSILWSDFPWVSLKRYIKAIGNLVMVLVVLTDPNPVEAMKTLFKRFTYVLIPLSIVLIKYYPEFGRYYSKWTYQVHYAGVALNKNSLGYLTLVCGFFFSWDLITMWSKRSISAVKQEIFINIIFLLMIMWLLNLANSMTSLVCLIIGVTTVVGLGIPVFKRNVKYIGVYIILLVLLFIFLQFSFDIGQNVIAGFERDSTLTGRTDLWSDVLNVGTNPWIGTGFESFWLGDRSAAFWEKYWWRPNQAHNGYLETYLNLGFIGLFILIGVILSTYKKSRNELISSFDYGRFRMAFLIISLMYNVTEAAFRGLHLMWFVFLLIAMEVHRDTYQSPGFVKQL